MLRHLSCSAAWQTHTATCRRQTGRRVAETLVRPDSPSAAVAHTKPVGDFHQPHTVAILLLAGDLSDVLLAHFSWYTFAALQRVYKHYDLPLRHPAIKLRRASFSSYGGGASQKSSNSDTLLRCSETKAAASQVFHKKLKPAAAAPSYQAAPCLLVQLRPSHFSIVQNITPLACCMLQCYTPRHMQHSCNCMIYICFAICTGILICFCRRAVQRRRFLPAGHRSGGAADDQRHPGHVLVRPADAENS